MIELDHVGVVARELAGLAERYQALGFTLTPLAPAAGGRVHNRCIMMQQGYLELMAIAPGASSATLERLLARHEGAHIIALSVDDLEAARARLRRAGFDDPTPQQSERPVDAADPHGPRARFALLPVPEQPEARINLIRHLTRDVLWQPRFMAHGNHVVALEDVTIAAPVPAAAAARLSRLAGRPVTPDPFGGFALMLSRGWVRVVAGAGPPRIVSVTLRTDDGNAAVARLAAAASIPYRIEADSVALPADAARGVALRFLA